MLPINSQVADQILGRIEGHLKAMKDASRGQLPSMMVDVTAAPYKAPATGSADARTAFAMADAAVALPVIPPGTYRIDSNITLTKPWQFLKGALLKPASGVTITIDGPITAGMYKIFDLSAGGTVVVAPSAKLKRMPAAWWGATGDGITDDTAPLQAAANCGRKVWLHRGTFRLTSQIVVSTDGVGFWGEGRMKSRFDLSALGGSTAAIAFSGSAGTPTLLTSDAAIGTKLVNVADSSGFTVGQYARIGSAASTGSSNIPKGEIVRIKGISGTQLELHDPLCDSYVTADDADIVPLTLLEDVSCVNVGFTGGSDSTVTHRGVDFTYCIDPVVNRSDFKLCHHAGVFGRYVLGARVMNSSFSDGLSPGLSYGVLWANGAQDCIAIGCEGRNLRHLVTVGGGTTFRGVARRVGAKGCTASQCRDAAFDSHPGAEDIFYIGNSVHGSTADGIIIQASTYVVKGNTIRNCNTGIRVQNLTDRPAQGTIVGNDIARCTGIGIYVDVQAAYTASESITISANVIANVGGRGIYCSLTTGGRFYGVVITGNGISGVTAASAIALRGMADFTVTGNRVQLAGPGNAAIYLENSEDGTVTSNIMRGDGSNGYGVRGIGIKDVVIALNRVRDVNAGIHLNSTCTDCVISRNQPRGCTTPYTLGGTGHIGDFAGTGAPGIAAPIGFQYSRLDGGAGTSFYVNEDGSGSGWAAK